MAGSKDRDGVPEGTPKRALFAEERRRIILEMLARDQHVLVRDLTKKFNVSAATLRSDLRDLENEGLLKRTHGGAVSRESLTTDYPTEIAALETAHLKAAIGAEGAKLVKPGDAIFVDSGSTTLEFMRALAGKSAVNVITHDLSVAIMAESVLSQGTVTVTGGIIRNGFHHLEGSTVIEQIESCAARICFLAATACSSEYGLTAGHSEGANIKRAYMRRSEQKVLLVDSSKIGHFAPSRFAAIEDMDVVITDSDISDDDRAYVEAIPGTRLIVADLTAPAAGSSSSGAPGTIPPLMRP